MLKIGDEVEKNGKIGNVIEIKDYGWVIVDWGLYTTREHENNLELTN